MIHVGQLSDSDVDSETVEHRARAHVTEINLHRHQFTNARFTSNCRPSKNNRTCTRYHSECVQNLRLITSVTVGALIDGNFMISISDLSVVMGLESWNIKKAKCVVRA